jgi:hypothetical protein
LFVPFVFYSLLLDASSRHVCTRGNEGGRDTTEDMTDVMGTMETLLHEADGKFNEKLRLCQGNISTNMNIYSDRTYNLRQQVLHNPQLTNDDHFMEMLSDTEQALTPEFTMRGDMDKKLTSLLCGLLKTLLREAISQPLFALRKIQIEMIYQWYQDKKRHVMDFAIGLHKTTSTTSTIANDAHSGLSVTGVGTRVQAPSALSCAADGRRNLLCSGAPATDSTYGSRLRAHVGSLTSSNTTTVATHQSSYHFSSASRDLSIRDDLSAADARYATTAKKLTVYRKRNLSKAEALRQELQQQQINSQQEGPKVVYKKDAKARQGKASEARQQLVAMRHGPSGPPSYLHHESTGPFFSRDAADTSEIQNAVGNAHQHLVKYFAAKMSSDSDKRSVRDTLTLYDFNRSRLEEETNRRLESEMFASQLGRTHHTHLRKGSTVGGTASDGTIGKPGHMHFNLGSAVKPTSDGSSGTAETKQQILGIHTFQNNGGICTTLSPYDNRIITRLDEAKLEAFMNRYRTDSVAHPAGASVAQMTPMSQQGNQLGAPCAGLDVALAPDAKITGIAPRLDTPIMDLLFDACDASSGVPSQRRIQELNMASRVREAFGSDKKPQTQRPGSAHHYPRNKIERAVTTPDDHGASDCMRLLPSYGAFLPRRPATAKR